MSYNGTKRGLLRYFYGTMVGPWWYHGAPMVTPERQGAFWIVGIGSRSSAFRECDLD